MLVPLATGKDFDNWNKRKKRVHAGRSVLGVHQRELWWISCGVNVGVEIDGKNETFERPAIVLRRFNAEMVWIIPVTSQTKSAPFYQPFTYDGKPEWAALTQLRTASTKRFIRKIGTVPRENFERMQRALADFVLADEDKRNPAQGGVSRRPKP